MLAMRNKPTPHVGRFNETLCLPEYSGLWRDLICCVPMWDKTTETQGSGLVTVGSVVDLADPGRSCNLSSDDSSGGTTFSKMMRTGRGIRFPGAAANQIEFSPHIPIAATERYTIAFVATLEDSGATNQGFHRSASDSKGNYFILRRDSVNDWWFRHNGADLFGGDTTVGVRTSHVFTWDGTNKNIYTGGVLSASSAQATHTAFDTYRIGWQFAISDNTQGDFEIFCMAKRAWSPQEVKLFHENPFGMITPDDDLSAISEVGEYCITFNAPDHSNPGEKYGTTNLYVDVA